MKCLQKHCQLGNPVHLSSLAFTRDPIPVSSRTIMATTLNENSHRVTMPFFLSPILVSLESPRFCHCPFQTLLPTMSLHLVHTTRCQMDLRIPFIPLPLYYMQSNFQLYLRNFQNQCLSSTSFDDYCYIHHLLASSIFLKRSLIVYCVNAPHHYYPLRSKWAYRAFINSGCCEQSSNKVDEKEYNFII